jgi:DNA-binding MarR family transcriptional regulator
LVEKSVKDSETDEIARLASRLRLAIGRLNRRLRQEGDAPIGASSFSALATLERLGPLKLGELAVHERVKPPTLTAIAASLEAAGLIERGPAGSDRRQVTVQITPAGRLLLDESRTRKTAFLALHMEKMSREGLAAVEKAAQLLEDIREDLS